MPTCSSVKVFNSDRRKTCSRLASLAHLHCPITLTQINIILYNIHFGHIADIGEFATLGNIHNNSNIILLHKKSFKLDIFAPLNYEIPIKNDYIYLEFWLLFNN